MCIVGPKDPIMVPRDQYEDKQLVTDWNFGSHGAHCGPSGTLYFEVEHHSKAIRSEVFVFVLMGCVLGSLRGVSEVLGKLFGLHRHERISHSLFSRKRHK